MTAMTVDDALDSLSAECARLRTDNTVLRGQLAAARSRRDTALAQSAQYRLVGW